MASAGRDDRDDIWHKVKPSLGHIAHPVIHNAPAISAAPPPTTARDHVVTGSSQPAQPPTSQPEPAPRSLKIRSVRLPPDEMAHGSAGDRLCGGRITGAWEWIVMGNPPLYISYQAVLAR